METTCWSRANEVLSKFKNEDDTPKYPNVLVLRADEIVHALADEADMAAMVEDAYIYLLHAEERKVKCLTLEVETLKTTVRSYAAGVAELRIEIALLDAHAADAVGAIKEAP